MRKASSNAIALLLVLGTILTGCSSNKGPSPEKTLTEEERSALPLELNGSSDEMTAGALSTVFFGFDSAVLGQKARSILQQNAMFLKQESSIDIQIEGHCDERGGIQYNLALGERRARAVKDYLVALGVDEGRVSILSYGKERPLAMGQDEQAWSRNRRANFVITAK